eukprot:6491373-Amphidinium_carterae.2
MRDLKTTSGTQGMLRSESLGALHRVSTEMLEVFVSSEFANTMGFNAEKMDASSTDARIANGMYRLVVESVGNLVLTGEALSSGLPYCLLILLHGSASEQECAREHVKSLVGALQNLEQHAASSIGAANFLRDLIWPAEQFTRKLLWDLWANDFKMTDQVRTAMEAWSSSWHSTLICENSLRVARLEQMNASGRTGITKCWHALNSGSLRTDYGKKEVPTTTNTRRGIASLPDYLYSTDFSQCSLGDERVDSILSKTPAFATLSAKNYMLRVMRDKCLIAYNGDWDVMESRAWYSLLVTPGTILYSTEEKKGWLVVLRSSWGVLGLQCRLRASVKTTIIANIMYDEKPRYLDIREPKKFRVREVEVSAPSSAEWRERQSDEVRSGIWLSPGKEGNCNLLEHAVRNGLRDWTRPMLEKLWRKVAQSTEGQDVSATSSSSNAAASVDDRVPRLKEDMVRGIARRVLKTDGAVDDAVRRHVEDGNTLVSDRVVSVPLPAEGLLRESADTDDDSLMSGMSISTIWRSNVWR